MVRQAHQPYTEGPEPPYTELIASSSTVLATVFLDLVILEAKRRGTIISCNAIGRGSSAVHLTDTEPIAIPHTL
ncbi:MAG: hypothetical protein IJ905_14315 [Fibrobacter sp.]|nr:hypothetical protein [Fibrobacter sp.]